MVAVALFYQGLALGRMGVVAPITAVVSAIVPVAWGLAFGERPSALALLGVALAVGSVALISSQSPTLDHAPETKSRSTAAARNGRGPGLRSVLRLVLQHQRTTRGCGRCSRRGGHRQRCSPSCSHSSPACAVIAPTRAVGSTDRRRGGLRRGGERVLPARVASGSAVDRRPGQLALSREHVLLACGVLHERFHRAQLVGLGVAVRGRGADRRGLRG